MRADSLQPSAHCLGLSSTLTASPWLREERTIPHYWVTASPGSLGRGIRGSGLSYLF